MTVEERLERLERQNRRMKKGFAVLILAVVAAVTMGQAVGNSVPQVVKARKFQVVGRNDQVMAELGWTRAFGYLFVHNRHGQVVAAVSADRTGSGRIQTTDSKGRPLVLITSKRNGEGYIATLKRGENEKQQH